MPEDTVEFYLYTKIEENGHIGPQRWRYSDRNNFEKYI